MKANTMRAVIYTCFDLTPPKFREYMIEFKHRVLPTVERVAEFEYKNDKSRYQIQGAAFLLTPVFFNCYNILYPRTFLYSEEINMSWYLHKANLSTMVIKTDVIIHKEAQTTAITVLKDKKTQKKAKLILISMIKSLQMYFSSYDRIIRKYSENEDT